MSGGHFGYEQYTIDQIANEVEELIEDNEYSPEVIGTFSEALYFLRRSFIMVQRIDYLVSGDDGEDSFIRRWNEELGQ
jgi:hypothetical protein